MDSHFTNRLIHESSPYLQQHARNPVNWYAWGDEALSKAKAENKVILVSIGYSACHWCHVMERESFEKEAVASIMNEHFVNIKIDREERPDLDHIYMDAIQAITGSGGWPLHVFLTPATKPFFGGTYFPPVKAFNRSSWTEVLLSVSQAWNERQEEIISQADYLTEHLRKSDSFLQEFTGIKITDGTGMFSASQCNEIFAAIMNTADTSWGGFGKAPKFPQTFTIQYLLQYHYFTGDKSARQQALLSIDKMLEGGIYDHIGGGLARYSTDTEWLAPHFEKMLYDNALLIGVLCDAYQLTAEKKYELAIRKTISFVTTELSDKDGGFFAALDADSEGEEGKYYVWQKKEIDAVLEEDAALFCDFYNVTEQGNWEEKNILRILKPADNFAKERKTDRDQLLQMLGQCLQKLALQREKRVRPALDDKIILGWNALILKAIARAAVVLQDQQFKEMAEKNIAFLLPRFTMAANQLTLFHTYKDGVSKYPAFLDDYAYLIAGFIQLYKTTFNNSYLEHAFDFSNHVVENFSDGENIFFYFTPSNQQDIIVRKKEIYDGATPSGNAVMAENLYYLSVIYDKTDWKERVYKMLKMISPTINKYPGSFGVWACLLLQQTVNTIEVAIIGTDFEIVGNKLLLKFIPNMILMASKLANSGFPLLKLKPASEQTLVYLCKNYACLAPFYNENEVLDEIVKSNKIQV